MEEFLRVALLCAGSMFLTMIVLIVVDSLIRKVNEP